MSNIPQVFPITVEQIDHQIALGKAVSGDELLHAIEWSVGQPLDDRLRKVVSAFSVVAVKRRGRPGNFKGREDFALRKVDERYPALLEKHEREARQRRLSAAEEGTVLPSAERSPSELAYTEILKDMTEDFPNIGWTALRNKHSAWNSGRFHSAENHIESDDYDAEIARLFPAPPES
jgi:hypothetical protein